MALTRRYDLGSDFACVDDVDATLSTSIGRRALAEACARRISTAKGMLFYDAKYGIDTRSFLNKPFQQNFTAGQINKEVRKDERVDKSRAIVEFIPEWEAVGEQIPNSLTVDLRITDANGPFEFTIRVSEVAVALDLDV